MNIVVLVKSAIDEVELRTDPAGHPVLKGAATKTSNFDRIGVEEALSLREGNGGTVTVLTLGGGEARRAAKEAMAMGADKALLLVSDAGPPDSLGTAYGLAKAVRMSGGVDLVVCSEGASDTYQAQVGAMMAELLGLPFLAYARKVEVRDGVLRCEQVFEHFTLVSEAGLPAVVSMVNGANQPRYPTLLQVMAAAKKPLEEKPLSSLKGDDYPETGMEVLDVSAQKSERRRTIIQGSPEEAAAELAAALRKEGLLQR